MHRSKRALAQYGDQYAVIVHLNDVFSLPRYLMGMENLLMAIAAEPELIQALVDMSVEINLVMAKELVARGVQIVYTGDDYCLQQGAAHVAAALPQACSIPACAG